MVRPEVERTQDDSSDCIRFVHAADLHIGSPFCGLAAIDEDLAALLAKATFKACENIVQFCIQQEVDFLLISGDIYDSADRRIYEQITFRRYLTRLAEANICVYLAFGNHDPLSGWSAHVNWPDNVYVMRGDGPDLQLYEGKNGNKAKIIGISFQSAHVTDNLAATFPRKESSWPFTIGMLHCTLGTSRDHAPYAPCSLSDLVATGYDYWALGHIHKPTIVKDNAPVVVYPGNSQGRHIGEDGQRGACFVTIKPDQSAIIEFIEMDTVRWIENEIHIDGMNAEDELIGRLTHELDEIRVQANGRPVLCRITLKGRCGVHATLIRDGAISDILQHFRELEDGRDDFVFIERLVDKTGPPIDRDLVALREDIIGDIVQITDTLITSDAGREGLDSVLSELFDASQARKYVEAIGPDEMKELICGAETYLLDLLIGEDDQ